MATALLNPFRISFPDVSKADPDGLVAIGGDLSVPRLLAGYRSGIFPWTDRPLTWWSPDPRAIFELETFRVPRRLAQKLRQGKFAFTINQAFEEVIRGCAEPSPGREQTWISPRFIRAYTELHRHGYAHSVEVWQDGRLVGGLYGVAIGGFFAGESMFHRVTDASKAALCFVVDQLKRRGFQLFDTQVATPVTRQMRAVDIPRKEYLARLAQALTLPVSFVDQP
ncbi:leucyl/phenylalanyl-tRNA--protein transferase [Candidatus Methylacidithermus pantelleriae]|uniref:Leucyl/phenylalanyl-tRNA--protein transferase n=1 Tax=Candidatus Methylacidithermus pantelleriae TaxID=2744239 RepID=A0A8J2BKV5_9BACT|nr:leucyl/phenylalanyl-tRNA--protein transferase [Candidatus Methylacidithermus pantelleriae]CAF0703681.1 Leucyl/phenylalanyl-tRNA--protein transferase [Candidatus Methylacidithermus pantelleriae]